MTNDELERRIDELELQLAQYHEILEEALEYNGKFQLGATWGVVQGSTWLVFFGATYGLGKAWKWAFGSEPSWIGGIVVFLASGFVWYHAVSYVQRGREGDEKKLWKWPAWEKYHRRYK